MPYRFDIHHFRLKLLWLNFLNTDTKSKLRDKYPHFIAVLKIDIEKPFVSVGSSRDEKQRWAHVSCPKRDVMGCNFVV